MTSDEIRELIAGHMEAWGREDIPALMANYADDCEVVSPMFHTVRGKVAEEASLRNLFRGLRQWSIRIDELLVDCENGERCALALTVQATQDGDMFGFPPSGKRAEVNVVHFFRFENGLIASERRLYDFSGLLLQLGILKAKAGA